MTPAHAANGEPNYGIVLPNWIVGADTDRLVEFAVAAEEAGWDGVFLADHLIFPPPRDIEGVDHPTRGDEPARGDKPVRGNEPARGDESDVREYRPFHDPWITMAAIATRTEEVTLLSWITPVPRRQPWQLARDLATLDNLSDGRVVLGTGLGRRTEYTTFGRPYDQRLLGRRYDEALDIVDGLWSGEPFAYDGEHFTVDDAVVLPSPVQAPRIPIVVGGVWPNEKPFQRGARWDGIVPHWPGDGVVPAADEVDSEETVREMLEYYHGRTDEPGEIVLPLDPPGSSSEYVDVCAELGATWLYTRVLTGSEYVEEPARAIARIREGPPD